MLYHDCTLHVHPSRFCILVLSFTHSTPELPNKQNHQNELNPAPDGNADLQGQVNVGQGQVQEEEEDR